MTDRPEPANLLLFESAPEWSPEFDISDPELLRTLEASQDSHFWFDARNRQILDFLRRDAAPPPARVLEVGCGTGTVLSALSAAGYEMTGLEMHRQLARRAAEENPRSTIFSANILSPPPALVDRGLFDVIALFDVVEHLENAEEVLAACADLLRPGGSLVGTVPALRALWSDYDVFAGHRRRFDRRGLESVFARAGLPRPRSSYFFQTLLPGMLVRRMLVGRKRGEAADTEGRRAAHHRALDAPSPAINALFTAACGLERTVRRIVPGDGIPGASLWFSVRVNDPRSVRAERRSRERTGDAP